MEKHIVLFIGGYGTASNEHLRYTEMGDPDSSEGGALVGTLVPFKGSGKGVPLPFQR